MGAPGVGATPVPTLDARPLESRGRTAGHGLQLRPESDNIRLNATSSLHRSLITILSSSSPRISLFRYFPVMADSTRTVIYLSPDGPVLKDISEPYRPTGDQSLLRVNYSGINPADIKHATIGLHSSVAGYDMSGEVLEIGPDSPFKPGDKIFGINPTGFARSLYMGAYQDFAIASSRFWYKLLLTGKLGLREAATLPVMTLTATDGLFNLLGLGFPEAGITGSTS